MPVFDAGIVIKKARKHDVATPPSLTAKELKKLKDHARKLRPRLRGMKAKPRRRPLLPDPRDL